MSPKKMIGLLFAASLAKGYEVFGQAGGAAIFGSQRPYVG